MLSSGQKSESHWESQSLHQTQCDSEDRVVAASFSLQPYAEVMEPVDVIVVGGGVSGLTAALGLEERGKSVLIIDKAKRLGGRVASGKIGQHLFNTGPLSSQLEGDCFDDLGLHPFTSPIGSDERAMGDAAKFCTAWSKHFSWHQGLVTTIRQEKDHYCVETEISGESYQARSVVLTCPGPQSQHLLEQSGFPLPRELSEICYTKELLLIVEAVLDPDQSPLASETLSLHQGATSPTSRPQALALKANPTWSNQHFGQDEEDTKAALLREFFGMFPGAHVTQSGLKRWRYANAVTTTEERFLRINTALDLCVAGDGFGDRAQDGLRRAVLSGQAISAHLGG